MYPNKQLSSDMRHRLVTFLAILVIANTCNLAKASRYELPKWSPPAEGVVRDAKTAITIARAIWISVNPDIGSSISDEHAWQSEMVATLQNGVWHVTNNTKNGEVGGALFIEISKRDGRILNIYITQ
jgi:hypothetical protein